MPTKVQTRSGTRGRLGQSHLARQEGGADKAQPGQELGKRNQRALAHNGLSQNGEAIAMGDSHRRPGCNSSVVGVPGLIGLFRG